MGIEWKKASEGMPDKSGLYLVRIENEPVAIGRYSKEGNRWTVNGWHNAKISVWAEKPEGGKGERIH